MSRPVRWFVGLSAIGLLAFYAPLFRADIGVGRFHMTVLNTSRNVSVLADHLLGGGRLRLQMRRPSTNDTWVTEPDPAGIGVGSKDAAWVNLNDTFGGYHLLVAGGSRWLGLVICVAAGGLITLVATRVGRVTLRRFRGRTTAVTGALK